MKNFSKIKLLASERGLKMKDLAAQCGISQQQLNRIVRTGLTSLETLQKLASILGKPQSYFVDDIQPDSDADCAQDPAATFNRFIEELAAQRRLTEKSMEQTARILRLLEINSGLAPTSENECDK